MYFDAATLFARRHDSLRMELLLRLAKTNLLREQSKNNSNVLTGDHRSQPHHAPYDKFMSFGLSEMIRCGNLEDALKLWVRISNGPNGYLTSRHSLDKIVKKAATCGAKELPPIEFTDKIHRCVSLTSQPSLSIQLLPIKHTDEMYGWWKVWSCGSHSPPISHHPLYPFSPLLLPPLTSHHPLYPPVPPLLPLNLIG